MTRGRILRPSGYVWLWRPGHPLAHADGYVAEHRLVVFDAGVDPRGKHVHHRNGDKADNRLENLEVREESDHHAHHVATEVRNGRGTWPRRTSYPHGTWQRYYGGCRCPGCRSANTARARENRRRHRSSVVGSC